MMDLIVHFFSATLAAFVLTTILLVTQYRHYFNQLRNAFVENVRRRNIATKDTGKANMTNGKQYEAEEGTFTIAFFHPHCSAGGGGERVLWKMIEAMGEMKEEALKNGMKKKKGGAAAVGDEVVRNCRNLSVVIYTVDEPREGYERGEFSFFVNLHCSSRLSCSQTHLYDNRPSRNDKTRPRSIFNINITQS
jgi:hypothetical protein